MQEAVQEELSRVGTQLSLGPITEEFEDACAKLFDRKYAVAVASGTDALELAVHTMPEGSEVLIPDMTVPMVGWAVEKAGAYTFPVGVRSNLLMNFERLKKGKDRFGAIIYVHTGGVMDGTAELIEEWAIHNGKVFIEDLSHAHMCAYKDRKAGTYGDISVASFYATKVLTCGEGGVVLTDSRRTWESIKIWANQGKVRGSSVVRADGYHHRMSEYQAAVGLACVKNAEYIRKARLKQACDYEASGIPLFVGGKPGDGTHSYYKCIVRLNEPIASDIEEQNPGVFAGRVHSKNDLPEDRKGWIDPTTTKASESHICLPVGLTVMEEKMEKAVEVLEGYKDVVKA